MPSTIRDQLTKHSETDTACARCHARIDPPGFALESFDPIGGERTWYRSLGEGKRISKREPYTIGPDVDPAFGEMPGAENHSPTSGNSAPCLSDDPGHESPAPSPKNSSSTPPADR